MPLPSLLIIFALMISSNSEFKNEQLKYPRVREAYANNEHAVQELLTQKNIDGKSFSIYLQAFKQEKLIEVWITDTNTDSYTLLKSYKVCKNSGVIGPKRKQGDKQVPEGFYHIDRFNPRSKFHLSLGINYPNKSDLILGDKNPGGDIFIHGACETIGCLPITDVTMEELYVICVEARNNGQEKIPVTIFPCRLSDENMQHLKIKHAGELTNIELWKNLKKGYDSFNFSKRLPRIGFLPNGGHQIYFGE